MRLNILVFYLICIGFLSEAVLAQGIIGVSPSNYKYDSVLRGGYAERDFVVTFSNENQVLVSIELLKEAGAWIFIEDNSSFVSRNNPWRFAVAVKPPADTPNGNYTGVLRIKVSPVGSEAATGHATGNVLAVLDVLIEVEITDIEILRCTATNFNAVSSEKGDDLVFSVDVLNSGNVRIKPHADIDLWDQEQISIVKSKEFIGREVLPTREENLIFRIPTKDLDIGQYWADFYILDCFDSQFLTLDVYEPGTLRAQGILKEIIAPINMFVGDTDQITVIFQNIGEKEVEAYFKGQINLGEKIVQVLESEKLITAVNSLSNFTFFFTPSKSGRYVVSGKVFYDKKRTFESSAVINAVKYGAGFLDYIIYALILATAIYFYYRIRKERRKYLKWCG